MSVTMTAPIPKRLYIKGRHIYIYLQDYVYVYLCVYTTSGSNNNRRLVRAGMQPTTDLYGSQGGFGGGAGAYGGQNVYAIGPGQQQYMSMRT